MIVKMKQVTIIVPEKDREVFINSLRAAGLLHIKHLSRPEDGELTGVEEKISQAEKAISIVAQYDKPEKMCFSSETVTETELINRIQDIIIMQAHKDELNKNIQDTKNTIEYYRPWGKFKVEDLKEINKKNVVIKLYKLTKSEYVKIKTQKNTVLINKEGGYYYTAVMLYKNEEAPHYEEVKMPTEGCDILTSRLDKCRKELEKALEFLREQKLVENSIAGLIMTLRHKHAFLEVYHGMKKEGGLSLVQGFCPMPDLYKIVSLAKKQCAGYIIEEPNSTDETPTLIRNPKWLKIVDPVFTFINTIPGYGEYDISAVFLIFFSVFFAMIVGDAGYGTLFLIVTYLARKKIRNVPSQPFHLMYVLSVATIVWGAISGTWFSFEQIAKLPILNSLIIEKVNSFADESQMFVMYLCFVIGVVHLTIGHTIKYIREINSINSLSQLGWISVLWGLFFLAGTLILNKSFPHFAIYLLIIGLLVVLTFSNFQKNIVKGIAVSFVDTFLGFTGGFSDIVSYLRLFAVGSASVAIASSFNSMAIGLGMNTILSGIMGAFIIFFAHALNITLSFLAVLVHGLRLNMLEFSGHLGMQWSGHKYEPFK